MNEQTTLYTCWSRLNLKLVIVAQWDWDSPIIKDNKMHLIHSSEPVITRQHLQLQNCFLKVLLSHWMVSLALALRQGTSQVDSVCGVVQIWWQEYFFTQCVCVCVSLKAYVCHLLRLVGVVFFGSRTHVHKTQNLSLYVHLLEIPLVLKGPTLLYCWNGL